MDANVTAIVDVAQGKLRGRRRDGIDAFLGVPFAAPPVGELRFRTPQPASSWAGVRDAQALGAQAPQDAAGAGSFMGPSPQPQDEDCLSVNIWRPAEDAGPRPVMVFIHGGGFSFGSAVHPCYDGSALARRGDAVVVTFGYRLGALGLLWHPCLADPDAPCDGNWAIQDQIAALAWIRGNIAAFGGDPENVTIFGESAGGVSVGVLCAAPAARPYFRRSIVQSGGVMPVAREQHVEAAEALLTALDLPADAARLRAVDLARLIGAQPAWTDVVRAGRPAPRPMMDGSLIPDWPNTVAGSGAMSDIDLMVTYNRDEFTMFVGRTPPEQIPHDDRDLAARLSAMDLPETLIADYRTAREARGEATDTLSLWLAMMTDRSIRVPSLLFLQRHVASGGRGFACAVTWECEAELPGLDGRRYGATHTVELPPLFGTMDATEGTKRLAGDSARAGAVSQTLQEVWTSFARDGRPTSGATGDVPGFAAPSYATARIGRDTAIVEDPWGAERKAMQAAMLTARQLA